MKVEVKLHASVRLSFQRWYTALGPTAQARREGYAIAVRQMTEYLPRCFRIGFQTAGDFFTRKCAAGTALCRHHFTLSGTGRAYRTGHPGRPAFER